MDKNYKPYSIFSIGFVSFLFGFAPAMILLGINWKILGAKERAKQWYIAAAIATCAIILIPCWNFILSPYGFRFEGWHLSWPIFL